MNALQQALDALHTQGAALWNVLSAIANNRPAPARQVLVYTVVLVGLLVVVPKIIKAVSK